MPPVTVKVPVVVGEGECQTVAQAEHSLSHPATEIKRVTKKVILKNAKVGDQKVVINAVVRKNVEYETQNHLIGSDKVEVPVSCCISVPGAMPGDEAQLLDAKVEVQEEIPGGGWPFKRLQEKLCVRIRIKVTRLAQVEVDATAITPEPVIVPVTETFFDP